MKKRLLVLCLSKTLWKARQKNTFMTRKKKFGTYLFASLDEGILDLLDSFFDVVGDGVASALGRARVRVVGALAVTTSGLRKLFAIVSIVKNMSQESEGTHCR